MRTRFLLSLAAVLGLVVGWSASPSTSPTPTTTAPTPAPRSARFDALTITLMFPTTSVVQGGSIETRLRIENPTSTTVTDPDCSRASGRYALVPTADPGAELWSQPIVDCADAHRIPPGYDEEVVGPGFAARDKYGAPLSPGEYLAVLDIPGRSKRLTQPVTVTARRTTSRG